MHPAYAVYATPDAFAAAYAGLVNRRYSAVTKVANAGGTIAAVAKAFGLSPWAAHHYRTGASGDEAGGSSGTRGTEGDALLAVIRRHGLTKYDGT